MAEIRVNASGALKLYDSDDSHYVAFQSGGTVSSNVTWTLPTADGSSGQTLTTDGSGTLSWATGSSADPSSADGDSLGTASAEWSDLYLADGGIIYFGNDQDVTLTHDPDDGLFLKSIATGDDNPVLLTLQTGETDMAADDVIGKIAFQAPDEGTGTDAILVSGAIQAVAEGNHSSSSNATRSEFMTGASEAATAKMSVSSGGVVGIGATLPGDLGVGLHVKTSDSGASVSGDADELVLENGTSSASGGLTILSATNGEGRINFGDSGDDNIGQITYGHTNNDLYIKTNTNIGLKIDGDGHVTKPLQSAFLITTASGSQHFDNSFLTFTTEKFDQNSDVSSSVFTAPVTGRYQFNSLIRHSGSGFTADTAIYNMLITSNQDFYVAMDGDYEESAIMLSIICDMDAGDTAKVKAYGDNDADVGTDAEQGWFSGYLVC